MKKGMIPSTVQAIADASREAAEQLKGKADGLISEVEGLDWTGADGDKYKADFASKVNEAVEGARKVLEDLAGQAEQNKTQQEQTSAQ